MKKFFWVILILSFLSSIFMILSCLALNDISHDYLSKKILQKEKLLNQDQNVPAWTECKIEWNIVRIDFIIRIILMLFIFLFLLKGVFSEKRC
ncbi:MAG: hypothetical protein PHV06_06345 [bacterium]|nr:hypothetical protein [bacterium]